MGIEPTTFHGIYINSLSCSKVNRHLTGTVTFESDFLKPNEHMVPQSREIHRRFYDEGTNLTPTCIQSNVCKISTQPQLGEQYLRLLWTYQL